MQNVGKETLWDRVKLLMRGLLLYNTIYWRRASDGLKPPRLTAAERKALAPPLNPEVIKPRLNPRARLLRRRAAIAAAVTESAAPVQSPVFIIGEPSAPESPRASEPAPMSKRRRRRKRYRRNLAKSLTPPPASGSSFFSRLIGK